SRGRAGLPGIRMGPGGGAPEGMPSSPRAKAAACARVSAILSSTAAASRQAGAASHRLGISPGSKRQPPLALGIVRTQLLEPVEIARLHAGDVLAAEA